MRKFNAEQLLELFAGVASIFVEKKKSFAIWMRRWAMVILVLPWTKVTEHFRS